MTIPSTETVQNVDDLRRYFWTYMEPWFAIKDYDARRKMLRNWKIEELLRLWYMICSPKQHRINKTKEDYLHRIRSFFNTENAQKRSSGRFLQTP